MNSKTKNTPISPAEVKKKRIDYIPEIIFETINDLIITKFDGTSSRILLEEIFERVCTAESGLTVDECFKNHYLDVEEYYREVGWKVIYDQPSIGESFKAYFMFEVIKV